MKLIYSIRILLIVLSVSPILISGMDNACINFDEEDQLLEERDKYTTYLRHREPESRTKTKCHYICKWLPTAFNVISIASLAVGGYFLYDSCSLMHASCDTMQNSCSTCIDGLDKSEATISKIHNASEIITRILQSCPEAKDDALQALFNVLNDCCEST